MITKKNNIVFLDAATVDLGDLDMSQFPRLGNYRAFASSKQSEIIARAKNADIIITNKCRLHASELGKLPRLKLICVTATGVDNLDLLTAQQRGIAVTNVKGYSTTSVAEHTLLFLLAFGHRLHEHHRSAILGEWSRSPHFTVLKYPFSDLAGKTLGIIGYGAIGRRVARLAKALGMKVLIGQLPGRHYPATPQRHPLRKLLLQGDFVSIHCPLTDQTRHLLNKKNLQWMKPTAVLINVARGAVVNERDVAKALHSGKLAGYGADVLSQEPPLKNHPFFKRKIWKKILLTPHIAWASLESRQRLVDEIAKNISAFQQGNKKGFLL